MDWNDSRNRFALEAVHLAASLVAEIQEEMVSETITKDDRSPVTVADFAAQAVIGYLLEQSFAGEVLVGEEQSDVLRLSAGQDTLERVAGFVSRVVPEVTPERVCDWIDRGGDEPGRKYWALDPIDGTKGFLRRAQYATALAYVEDGEVQLGVLGCPNINPDLQETSPGAGSLLVARRGGGSWIARLSDFDKPDRFSRLSVSKRKDPKDARLLRSFESSHTNTDQIDAFQRELGGEADPVRMDSQVKYALLASGEGEIYLRLLSPQRMDYKEKIWDQAAGSIIVAEAGGRVTDLEGASLDFSQGRTLKGNRGICASNGFLHERALEAIRVVGA
ncbi:MAG: 3'(2'),5'-bisphosphate nucleotidase [Chloroflexi bacterium]|nr:MAG: 3'(2'),5'-bisphosphate nucleotidase [Chloroflexota bacterium]